MRTRHPRRESSSFQAMAPVGVIPITLLIVLLWVTGSGTAAPEEWPPFDRARREDKPILLVVGDWRTRFPSIASKSFVSVVVDRDERPDVAEIYGSAFVLLGESGRPELPFALVLTAEGRPTARVPVVDLAGALDRFALEYKQKRTELEARAGVTTLSLREAQVPAPARGPLRPELIARALRGLLESYDARRARFGLGPAPPPPGALRLLFEEQARVGSAPALQVATGCLEALARSGLPLREVGVARLEANALLLEGYVLAHEATAEAAHRQAATALADWAIGSMRAPGGGFRAGLAADGADERVFVGANGLLIGALARVGRPADLQAANQAAAFLAARSVSLPRYVVGDRAYGSAFLEDYALLAEGLLELHEATDELRWREAATRLVETALSRFLDPTGSGFFDTDAAHGPSIVRLRNGYDGALPAGNAVMASVLLRLARATGETRYAQLARRTVDSFVSDLEQAPRGLEALAAVAAELLPLAAAKATDEEALPSQIVVGPVEIGVALSASRVPAGGALEARIVFKVADGWRVIPHGAGGKERVGLTVSVPGGGLAMGAVRFPAGAEPVTVDLRVPADAPPGPKRVRIRLGFQACRGDACRPPESALLEAPLVVLSR